MSNSGTMILATGYCLRSGGVVFLREDGEWDSDFRFSFLACSADDLQFLRSSVRLSVERSLLADGYEVEVMLVGGEIVPVKMRERFRLLGGPTVAYLPSSLVMGL